MRSSSRNAPTPGFGPRRSGWSGDIGWEPDLSASALDKLKGSSGVKVVEYPDLSFYDVRFTDRPAHLFGDKLVRQAFAYAIDKEAITRKVAGGHGTPLWGDVAPETWAFDPSAVVKYKPDLARAKQLMQQAGWVVGADGIAARDDCVQQGRGRAPAAAGDRAAALGPLH